MGQYATPAAARSRDRALHQLKTWTIGCVLAAIGLVAILSTMAAANAPGSGAPLQSLVSGLASWIGGSTSDTGGGVPSQPAADPGTQPVPQAPAGGIGSGGSRPPAAVSGGS